MEQVRKTQLDIRDASVDDAESIASIYNHYVLTTSISFEETEVPAIEMAGRIADVQAAGLPWLVAEVDGVVAGYAYATKWRVRHAYRFSVESSVYLAPASAGQGIGTALYRALLDRLRDGRLSPGDRRHRVAESRQHRAARKTRVRKGGAVQGGRLQVRPLDRCRILAVEPLPTIRRPERTGFRGQANAICTKHRLPAVREDDGFRSVVRR